MMHRYPIQWLRTGLELSMEVASGMRHWISILSGCFNIKSARTSADGVKECEFWLTHVHGQVIYKRCVRSQCHLLVSMMWLYKNEVLCQVYVWRPHFSVFNYILRIFKYASFCGTLSGSKSTMNPLLSRSLWLLLHFSEFGLLYSLPFWCSWSSEIRWVSI